MNKYEVTVKVKSVSTTKYIYAKDEVQAKKIVTYEFPMATEVVIKKVKE